MASPGDSTAVIRMQKDFNAFISGSGDKREQPSIRLNLDAEVYSIMKRHQPSSSSSSESIQSILGKTPDNNIMR